MIGIGVELSPHLRRNIDSKGVYKIRFLKPPKSYLDAPFQQVIIANVCWFF